MLRVINALNGSSVCIVSLGSATSVWDVKEAVQSLAGIPRLAQRLLWGGRELRDGEMVMDALEMASPQASQDHCDDMAEIALVKISFNTEEQLAKEIDAARSAYRQYGGQALCTASSVGDADAVAGLLRRDRGLVHSTMGGLNALCYTANPDIAVQLLRARANPNAKDWQERSPLHHAVEGGHANVAKLLISARANANVKDNQEHTPLHHAVKDGNSCVTKILLSSGARVVATNKTCKTPLHLARGAGVAALLLNARADPGVPDKHGNTPLHMADDSEFARVLLDARAEPNSANKHGNTPLHLATVDDVITALLDARADANKAGEVGMTPREIVARRSMSGQSWGQSDSSTANILRTASLSRSARMEAQPIANSTRLMSHDGEPDVECMHFIRNTSSKRPSSRQTPRVQSKRRTPRRSSSLR